MAKYLSNIDLNKNQLQQAALHPTGAAPSSPVEGQVYFNTSASVKQMYYWNGTDWIFMGSQGDITSISSNTTAQLTVTNGFGPDPSLTIVTGAVANGGTALATGDQIYDFVTGLGYVESVTTGNSTFVNLADSGTATDPVLTASLSATGTPSSATFLRGDNVWATPPDDNTTSLPVKNSTGTTQFTSTDVTGIRFAGTGSTTVSFTAGSQLVTIDSGNETITLTGEVTGSGTTSITTTVANNVLDIDNFTAATIVTEAEGIANNDNDTTLPTSAAVKDYVDSNIVGNLVYQGGYNAATNTPDLDVSPSASIKTGWTYTVTADGTFFTEQVRVGDVLIAETNAPTTLADWTTVQSNIDLASASQVGIGNVAAGTGISVSYASGTATVTNTQTNSDNTYATTISATATVTHNLGTRDVIVQLYDTVTYETVYADVDRDTVNAVIVTFAATPANSIRVLVQKIG